MPGIFSFGGGGWPGPFGAGRAAARRGARLRQGLGDEGGLKPLHLGLEALFRKRGTFRCGGWGLGVLGLYPVGGGDGFGGVETAVVQNGQVLSLDFLSVAHNKGPFHDVAQFPDVAGAKGIGAGWPPARR